MFNPLLLSLLIVRHLLSLEHNNSIKILKENDFLPKILPVKIGVKSRRKTFSDSKDSENLPPAIQGVN